MSLLDDLRNLLTKHHQHVTSQTNQGTARLIEDHLSRLESVAEGEIAAAEVKVHSVLGELYRALDAPAPAAPGETPGPADTSWAAAPRTEAPAPADAEPAPAAAPEPAEENPTGMH